MPSLHQIVVVIGCFHRPHAEIMLKTALSTAANCGLEVADQIWVPGSMEKPLALKRSLLKQLIDGAVALGVIERGQTAHGRVMGQAVIDAILGLQLDLMKPIGIGILGPEIETDQIQERLVPYARDAVLALHAMLSDREKSC